jgi:hypothetical protein
MHAAQQAWTELGPAMILIEVDHRPPSEWPAWIVALHVVGATDTVGTGAVTEVAITTRRRAPGLVSLGIAGCSTRGRNCALF